MKSGIRHRIYELEYLDMCIAADCITHKNDKSSAV